jgi:hypothetical protein
MWARVSTVTANSLHRTAPKCDGIRDGPWKLLTNCYRNCVNRAETRHHPPTRRFVTPQLRHHFLGPDNTRKTIEGGFRSCVEKTSRFDSCHPHKRFELGKVPLGRSDRSVGLGNRYRIANRLGTLSSVKEHFKKRGEKWYFWAELVAGADGKRRQVSRSGFKTRPRWTSPFTGTRCVAEGMSTRVGGGWRSTSSTVGSRRKW